jgi:hypothetical protein
MIVGLARGAVMGKGPQRHQEMSPMPPQPPPKGPKKPEPQSPTAVAPPPAPSQVPAPKPAAPQRIAAVPAGDLNVGVAVSSEGGTVTARRAGGLRDMALDVDPDRAGVKAALQHLAKAVNIAFQSDFGENELESVYQAAIVRRGEVHVVHREYFGFGDSWFGQFGRLLRSMQLTLEGPDPASPEGQQRIAEKGPATIRGLLNVVARKLDLVAEYEDRVPAYVEQMFDRLEASGIIVGWDRGDWEIQTTRIGLDIRIVPKAVEPSS